VVVLSENSRRNEHRVLKPLKKLDLPERTGVRVMIRGSFSKLIEELGEIEAKEDYRRGFRENEESELLWIEVFWVLLQS